MSNDHPFRVRLLMLRHGQVANHKSDVGLTDLGTAQADQAGRWFASEGIEVAGLLSGETRRTRDTADTFAEGYRQAGGAIPEPVVSFALRNPDLYLGGHRINMGQGATFLASQVDGVSEAEVEAHSFYQGFLTADDRIGYWLGHAAPPGENAADVGSRIDAFARSLADAPEWFGKTVVAISHSPVQRAVRRHHWGDFSREPPFLHGYALTVAHSGGLTLESFESETGDIPATSRPGPGIIRPEKDASSRKESA